MKELRMKFPLHMLLLVAVVGWLGLQGSLQWVRRSAPHAPIQTSPVTLIASNRSSSTEQHQTPACLKQHVKSQLAACPGLPGYCPRPHSAKKAGPAAYLKPEGPNNALMAQQRQILEQFLAGPGFKERVLRLQQLPDKQGILISAGKQHLGNLAMTLHALRKHHGCTLPVEVAYRGDKEVDTVTRATLSNAFAPVYWLDLEQQEYPSHHHQGYTFDRYEPKIYALYHTRFQQVLMLDADSFPLRDPSHVFNAPQVVRHGTMLWLDFWNPLLASTTFVGHDSVWGLLGIKKQEYWAVLSAGQGYLHRAAESGELFIDRVRHADALEYLWYLTSFSSVLYKHVMGDKDTFGYAFALAEKLHELYFVATPPGAAFKDEGSQWRFHAMLQYDHLGQPTFFHRTFEKWVDALKPPHHVDVITGPLPSRFILNYLGNKTAALTPDLPQHVFVPLQLDCPAPAAKLGTAARHGKITADSFAVGTSRQGMFGGCPLTLYLQYQQLLEFGLPVARQPSLEAACQGLEQQLLRLQPTTAAAAWSPGHRSPQAIGKRPIASVPAPASGVRPAHRSVAAGRLLRSERGWQEGVSKGAVAVLGYPVQDMPQPQARRLRSDHVLHVGKSLQSASDPGGAGSAHCAEWDTADLWGHADGAMWLKACREQRGRPGQAGTAPQQAVRRAAATAATDAGSLSKALPSCESVEWSVAKYVLHDAAEAVERSSSGKLLWDPDPRLPVLQLARSLVGFRGRGGDAGEQDTSPCSYLDGAVSPVDDMQLALIPAARAWVQEHLSGLPALQTGKGGGSR